MKILNVRRIKKPVLVFLSILAFMPGLSHAWWNADWSSRKKITLNMTPADIKGTLAEAPILVRLHTGNFDFVNSRDDGKDIRFFLAKDDKTPLNFHIEKYDPLNEMALIWVQVPNLVAGKETAIYMYSGNSKATPADDPANTYDNNMAAVFHFAEKESPKDWTSNNNNATQYSLRLGDGSLIGGGATFSGQSSLNIKSAPSIKFDAGRGMTVSA